MFGRGTRRGSGIRRAVSAALTMFCVVATLLAVNAAPAAAAPGGIAWPGYQPQHYQPLNPVAGLAILAGGLGYIWLLWRFTNRRDRMAPATNR